MSHRVPGGGVDPEWPNEPGEGQPYYGNQGQYYGDQGAQYYGDQGGQYYGDQGGQYYGDQGAQYYGDQRNGYGHGGNDGNGNGASRQDQQQQYGRYGGPGPGAPPGYPQQHGYGGQGGTGYGQHGYSPPGYPPGQGQGYDEQQTQAFNYQGAGPAYPGNGQGYNGDPHGYQDRRGQGNMRRYESPPQFDDQHFQGPGQGPGGPALPGQQAPDARPPRKVRFRRTRRLFRLRSVRIVSALVAVFLVWVMFSVGQAAFKNNGQGMSANVAEWARDHGLGPVVTFGEWLSYNPPPKGGKPSFSLAVPSSEAVSPGKQAKDKAKAFVPDIPATVKSLAGQPIAGEGQWRVVDQVNGNPAILTTFLRDATYTSQVNGIASIDQRLVKFSLRPGSEDPGPGNWGVSDYVPTGQRKGLLATFNGGFKLDSAGGGFYLNGIYHGSLVKGTASIVYYKNGTIKIGEWGRDFKMNSSIEGVRQNLMLLVDRSKVAANSNSDVMSNWGATLGGGYYVWRSGIGITKDNRIVYVYGPALDAQDLGDLLQRAGAVEGMQMDINPAWMKFDYYQAKGKPNDPTPVPLLPTQQPTPYSYYSPSTRDFTAVYAR
jgi:hypothetical protein